jgi:uncharacterized protein YjeT (DUF2065 family)
MGKIMNIVIKIIVIIIIFMAIMYMLKPHIMKKLMEFFKQGRRLYLVGLARFVLAVIFLLGATQCGIVWLIIAFGILFIISGLLIFALGLEKVKSILDWYLSQPLFILRLLALIALALGAIIVYAA